MRDSAGLAIDRDNPAPPAPTATHFDVGSHATLIRKCLRCGSHFEQDFEELVCWQCVAWAELLERGDSYAYTVRGSRGGRR